MSKNLQKIGEDVVAVLCEIYDPEIPVNIYELGLIYKVDHFEICYQIDCTESLAGIY